VNSVTVIQIFLQIYLKLHLFTSVGYVVDRLCCSVIAQISTVMKNYLKLNCINNWHNIAYSSKTSEWILSFLLLFFFFHFFLFLFFLFLWLILFYLFLLFLLFFFSFILLFSFLILLFVFFLLLLFSFLLFFLFFFLSLSLSSLPLSYSPFRLPSLLNVFFLNLSCVYSFCFVLLNFTCLRVAVCLSMFRLIKLFFNHIIKHCTKRTRYPDPAGMITGYPDPNGKWHPAMP